MWSASTARRTLLGLARAVQGKASASVVRAAGCAGFSHRRGMASDTGPVYEAIVNNVTHALQPVELELIDDSAAHAKHAGMKDRRAVEV